MVRLMGAIEVFFGCATRPILDSYPNARVNGVFIVRRDIREEQS